MAAQEGYGTLFAAGCNLSAQTGIWITFAAMDAIRTEVALMRELMQHTQTQPELESGKRILDALAAADETRAKITSGELEGLSGALQR